MQVAYFHISYAMDADYGTMIFTYKISVSKISIMGNEPPQWDVDHRSHGQNGK